MHIQQQITEYLATLPAAKRADMEVLYALLEHLLPNSKLWYLDGKDEKGKIVSNPNIGFGSLTRTYADGRTTELYQVGISANTKGISMYFMGIMDKDFLPENFSAKIGKARVTGYCITFKTLNEIQLNVLEDAIRAVVLIQKNL